VRHVAPRRFGTRCPQIQDLQKDAAFADDSPRGYDRLPRGVLTLFASSGGRSLSDPLVKFGGRWSRAIPCPFIDLAFPMGMARYKPRHRCRRQRGGSPGHGAAGGGDREQGGRVRAAAGLVSRDRLIFCPFAEDVAGPPRKFSRTYRQHTPSSRAVRDRGGPPLRCGGERRAFPSRTHCVVQRYLFDDCEQTIGRRLGNPQSAMTEMMLKLVGVAAMVTVE
jgi:hypothetical protein